MRFREILAEYDRSKTAQQMSSTIATSAERESQLRNLEPEQQVEQVLEKAESADPTPNKKYVLWIVRQFVKNELKFEDINEFLKKDITAFHELPKKRKQQLGIEPDINRYTWRDIREIAIKLEKATDLEEPVDANLDYEHIDDMKVLYVGDMGQLIIPETEAASCEIGRGTRWCTAATESDNEFSNYASKGPLYVWIPSRKMPEKKQSNKFQFHFESAQFMDENDEQIESDLFRYFRTKHPVLKNLFAKGERVIAQDANYAYQYALRVIEGRFPAGEEVLAQDSDWAYWYALDVIKQLEGENRWPAGEKSIARHPKYAFQYARHVIEGRFPEGEAVIAGHMGYAVEYAYDVIKKLEGENRFPAGEEVIAQDAESAHFYAWKVIGGRFSKGEAAIAQHPEYALNYSIRVIKERFPEPHRAKAEATIKKHSRHWKAYVDFVKQSENQ